MNNIKITVDAVVFSYFNEKLHTLLINRAFDPYKGMAALAGGYIGDDETADDAVLRKLKEETNIQLEYLEQLYTFSDINRDPRGRTISISYYGLIDSSKYELESNKHADSVYWYPIEYYTNGSFGSTIHSLILAFDHKEIIIYAIERLRNKIKYTPIGFELLPKYFSMSELHKLYEEILGKKIDRRNFSKKINSYGLLDKTPYKTKGNVGRNAQLYCFNEQRYKELEIHGVNFEF